MMTSTINEEREKQILLAIKMIISNGHKMNPDNISVIISACHGNGFSKDEIINAMKRAFEQNII